MDISKISYYYFHPFHENLPKTTGILLVIGTLASAILSLGIIPIVMAFFYDKKFIDLTYQNDPNAEKVDSVAKDRIHSAHSQPTQIINSPKTEKPSCLRNTIQQFLEKDFAQASQVVNGIFKPIDDEIPSISESINGFTEQNQQLIAKIQEKGGWNQLKAELGLGMADPYEESLSFEAFRISVNRFVVEQVNLILEHLEIGPIKVEICGTPGWNSDVDIGLRPENPNNPLTTEEMVITKILCELTTMRVLGKFPGIGLDTEWYVDLNFLAEHLETPEAERKFYTIDFIMAIVQAYTGLSAGEWERYCQTEIQHVRNDDEKNLLDTIFTFIRSLSKEREKAGKRSMIFEEKVKQLVENGAGRNTLKDRKKSIRVYLKRADTLKLEEEVEKIEDKQGEKIYNGKLLSDYRYLLNLSKRCASAEDRIKEIISSDKKNENKEELEGLLLEHDILFSLINASQPESLYTLSGINSTLFVKGGQKYERILAQKIKEFGRKCKEIRSIDKSERSIKIEIKNQRQMLVNSIKVIFADAPKSNANQLLVATAERLAQFKHVLEEKKEIIEASKYLLRIAEGLDETLGLIKKKKIIDPALTNRVNKLLRLSRRLEKCKRKFAINDFVARTLLIDRLSSQDTPSENAETILKAIFKKFNKKFNGQLYKKSEKLTYLEKKLKEKFKVEIEDDTKNILRAFVGYSRQKHSELREFHEIASEKTLEHHENLINTVKDGIHELCIQVRQLVQNNELAFELSEEAVRLFTTVPDDSSSDSSNE